MPTPFEDLGAPDLRRIALVTRRFTELRGLYWVAGGVWLLLLLAQSKIPVLHEAQMRLAALSTSFLIAIVLLHGYYARRFGRVDRPDDGRFWWWAWLLITGAVVDQITYTRGVPSVTLFVLAGTSIGAVLRDWPFRTHHFVLAGVALFASVSFAHVTDDASRRVWLREIFPMMAVASIVTGWLDHRLLARTLRGPRQGEGAELARASGHDAK